MCCCGPITLDAGVARLQALFPGSSPEHQFLLSLCDEILGRPDGVPGDNTPFCIDHALMDGSQAAAAYKHVTAGQLPSQLLEDPRYQAYFTKRAHKQGGSVITLSPHVFCYVLGQTDEQPGTPAHRCEDAADHQNTHQP
jgi:hypothetical protein